MLRLPQRYSLVSATADALREGILSGEWTDHLPGERMLCDRLQVSRSTLREALDAIERQGLIERRPSRACRLLSHPQGGARAKVGRIGLLSLHPVDFQRAQTIYLLHQLREHLQDAGLHLELHSEPRMEHDRTSRRLAKIVKDASAAAWLLLSVPAPVQRWFQAHGPPSLVVGFCHEGVRLPSFDVDLEAVCRHAAGALCANGHRRIALVRHLVSSAGMQKSEEGFIHGTDPRCEQRFLGHDGTPGGICAAVDHALAGSRPPTGLLVCDAGHAVCVASHLLSRGLSLPRDISIVSRDYDDLLGFFRPVITHYRYRKVLYARRLARLAIQLATQGSLPAREYRLFPRMIPGQTLGKKPASSQP